MQTKIALASTQPQDRTSTPGSTEIFCVDAIGTGNLGYQWLHNGVYIDGAVHSCYTNSNVNIADGGSYSAIIFGDLGATLSDVALLKFSVPLEPGNDGFGNATLLAKELTVQGDNSLATPQTDEPDHYGDGDNHQPFGKRQTFKGQKHVFGEHRQTER